MVMAAHGGKREGMVARPNHPVDKVRELQRSLFMAAKRSRERRFHALYDRIWRVQGSTGTMATRQAEKMKGSTVWTRPVNTTAYWSPDGDLGVFEPSTPLPDKD